MQGMQQPGIEMQGDGNDAVKYALQQLIKAMYGKMDYGMGDEPMEDGDVQDAVSDQSKQDGASASYNPIEAGDAEPIESNGMDDSLRDEIKSFMNPSNPNAGKKSMTVMAVSKSAPKKKAKRKAKKKMDY